MRAQQMTALVWVAIVFLTHGHSEEAMRLLPQAFGSESGLRGLSVVSGEVAWVSGTGGTVSRTTDGGETWQVQVVPGAEKLDFRDVEAFGASVAYLLAAGPGDASRVYKTTDGGKTWRQQAVNADAQGFWDAMAFWDERNGIVFGDPVDGQFRLLITEDGGETWRPLAPTGMPRALPREGAFAASGTCLVTGGTRDVWFATGGAGVGAGVSLRRSREDLDRGGNAGGGAERVVRHFFDWPARWRARGGGRRGLSQTSGRRGHDRPFRKRRA